MTGYVDPPKFSVPLIGKDLAGDVLVSFMDADRAVASTNGRGSRQTVTLGDSTWHVHLFLRRGDDGWRDDESGHSTMSRDGFRGDPPPTYARRVREAVQQAVATVWTPEIDVAARYANACRRLAQLEPEAEGLREELAGVVAKIEHWTAVARESAPTAAAEE